MQLGFGRKAKIYCHLSRSFSHRERAVSSHYLVTEVFQKVTPFGTLAFHNPKILKTTFYKILATMYSVNNFGLNIPSNYENNNKTTFR